MAKNLGYAASIHSGGISWSLTLDTSRNIYIAGTFKDTIDCDPGGGTFYLIAPHPSYPNTFITKLDHDGNFIWAKQLGNGIADCYVSALGVDVAGNVFVTGSFDYTIDVDPGPGIYSLTTASTTFDFNAYIVKLNTSGDFVWGHQLASTTDAQAIALGMDKAGNVYTTGFFSGTIDFDPGPGVFNLTATGTHLSNYIDILDNNGNLINAEQIAGDYSIQADAIFVDKKANIYLTGIFQGTYDFDPGTGVNNLATGGPSMEDLFVTKLYQLKISTDTATACGSYNTGDHIYTVSGAYIDTVSALAGMDSIVKLSLTINAMPAAGSITGPDTVCGGHTITLTDTAAGGNWFTSNGKATVAAGIVSGITYGLDTIIYVVTNSCGHDTAARSIIIKNCKTAVAPLTEIVPGVKVSPNPGSSLFSITLISDNQAQAIVTITDMLGRRVKDFYITPDKETPFLLNEAAGVYLLTAVQGFEKYTQKIVVVK